MVPRLLPQIKLPVASGARLAFIASFDEVVVTFFISGGEMSTLPRRMFNALRDRFEPTIAAISTILVVLSVLTVPVLALLRARRPIGGTHTVLSLTTERTNPKGNAEGS